MEVPVLAQKGWGGAGITFLAELVLTDTTLLGMDGLANVGSPASLYLC